MIMLFEVKYYQPTQTKGARIRIFGLSNKFMAYDYRYNTAGDMAIALLMEQGFHPDDIIEYIPTKTGERFIYEIKGGRTR